MQLNVLKSMQISLCPCTVEFHRVSAEFDVHTSHGFLRFKKCVDFSVMQIAIPVFSTGSPPNEESETYWRHLQCISV